MSNYKHLRCHRRLPLPYVTFHRRTSSENQAGKRTQKKISGIINLSPRPCSSSKNFPQVDPKQRRQETKVKED